MSQLKFENGMNKFNKEFDIINLANHLRINKLVHDLVLTK